MNEVLKKNNARVKILNKSASFPTKCIMVSKRVT